MSGAEPKHDWFGELCDLLREIGAELTLYGMPVTESDVHGHCVRRVEARLLTGDPLDASRGIDLDARWIDLGGEG
jgi:hypothetical protein